MLDEVRRWRKEACEERSRQTLAQQTEEDRRLIEALGLRTVDPAALVTPAAPPQAKKSA